MTKKQKAKEEFVRSTTALTVKLFSTLSPEEQERRMAAAEKMLTKIETSKTSSCTAGTSEIPVLGRAGRSEARQSHQG